MYNDYTGTRRSREQMGGVQFRHAQSGDATAVLAIKQDAIAQIDSSVYTPRQLDAWRPDDEALSDFRGAIESERFEILLAEIDGEPAGYGVFNAPKNRIDAVFVRAEFGGRGIATSLIRQFESRARMYGNPELKIVSSLNAKSFYASLGYWDFGRKTREIDGVSLEFAIMRKIFDRG